MVHKRERLLMTGTRVPWEVVQASVEWVQPSEDDLGRLFGCPIHHRHQPPPMPPPSPPPRSTRIYSSPPDILRKVHISPDFSEFSNLSKKKPAGRRGRSTSCLLDRRDSLQVRSKRADFDTILRDISDDSLYAKFKNNLLTEADKLNNNTTLHTPRVVCGVTNKEGGPGSMEDDDVWTDISLEESDTAYSQSPPEMESVPQENTNNSDENVTITRELYEASEYLQFSEDVYRQLSGVDIALERQTKNRFTEETRRKKTKSARAMKKLFDQLLSDIYSNVDGDDISKCSRRRSEWSFNELSKRRENRKLVRYLSQSCSLRQQPDDLTEERFSIYENLTAEILQEKSKEEVNYICDELRLHILETGKCLVRELQERDELVSQQQSSCDLLTAYLQAASNKRSEDTQVKFSVSPGPGDTGFTEWSTAMKMVARLPDGVPTHFRKTLWLTLAEKHLSARGVCWQQTEKGLFSESCNPDDEELSVQIVKDLHRTGCSLFCGVSGQHNQAVLKRVLLAFARWNKNVGYCQGLNMLAALILQVMQGSQSSTVKVMIYLIEGVLPESYFGQNLRGLSVDMAVFRDLLRLKLPELSRHLDQLQHDSKEAGTSYEPPLMDVFTMQWFLTIFSNCLPQPTVLRVWDLLFLEGNEVLLKTALAIWNNFSERIQAVRSADEFYSIMAVHTREMLEFGLMDPNNLIKAIDTLSIPEVAELREKYVYNITPWTVATVAKKGLKLFYDPYDSDEEHMNNWQESSGRRGEGDGGKITPFSNHPDREKIALDISVLKKQYMKLRERQRQAHIIFTAACSSENIGGSSSPALNHLLLGKSALLSMKGRRIEGTIPPTIQKNKQTISGETLHWKDAESRNCKDRMVSSSSQPNHMQFDDVGRLRSRSLSSGSSSSSSTELCDDSSESEITESASPLPPDPTAGDNEGAEDQSVTEEAVVEVGVKRRNSERALMQILQENSEILRRIQSQSAIKSSISTVNEDTEKEDTVNDLKLEVFRNSVRSLDREMKEPDEITEIRRKYERLMNKQRSLDTPRNNYSDHSEKPKSFDMGCSDQEESKGVQNSKPLFSPFPIRSPRRKSQLGVQLGLYSPDSPDP